MPTNLRSLVDSRLRHTQQSPSPRSREVTAIASPELAALAELLLSPYPDRLLRGLLGPYLVALHI